MTAQLELTVAGKPTGDTVTVQLLQADLSGTYEIQTASNGRLLSLVANGLRTATSSTAAGRWRPPPTRRAARTSGC